MRITTAHCTIGAQCFHTDRIVRICPAVRLPCEMHDRKACLVRSSTYTCNSRVLGKFHGGCEAGGLAVSVSVQCLASSYSWFVSKVHPMPVVIVKDACLDFDCILTASMTCTGGRQRRMAPIFFL